MSFTILLRSCETNRYYYKESYWRERERSYYGHVHHVTTEHNQTLPAVSLAALALMVGDSNKTLLKSIKCCDLSVQLSLQVACWRKIIPQSDLQQKSSLKRKAIKCYISLDDTWLQLEPLSISSHKAELSGAPGSIVCHLVTQSPPINNWCIIYLEIKTTSFLPSSKLSSALPWLRFHLISGVWSNMKPAE